MIPGWTKIVRNSSSIMKRFVLIIFVIGFIFSPVYGHKLITHDDTHRSFETALVIPDHKISWAIYEDLGAGESKFYSFEAKKGDSFYASIVVPKMEGLEEYSPTIVLVNPRVIGDQNNSLDSQFNVEKYPYEGKFPGTEFYEPFGQVTYWERQEVNRIIPSDGKYFIIVTDEKNQSGKYSLAVGKIEDFSGADFFTILPKAWFDTKLFVNDYVSLLIFFGIIFVILFLIGLGVKRKMRKN